MHRGIGRLLGVIYSGREMFGGTRFPVSAHLPCSSNILPDTDYDTQMRIPRKLRSRSVLLDQGTRLQRPLSMT